MASIVFLDEAGDLILENTDQSFPVFTLMMVVFDTEQYSKNIEPAVKQLKRDFFGNEDIILHSRDIRKAQKAFTSLNNQTKKMEFIGAVSALMSELKYQLIGVTIRKILLDLPIRSQRIHTI